MQPNTEPTEYTSLLVHYGNRSEERLPEISAWLDEVLGKKSLQGSSRLWYLLDLLAVSIVGASGQMCWDPSKEYANGNEIMQYAYAICGAIGTSAPTIWATLNITHSFRQDPPRTKKILQYKNRNAKQFAKELFFILAGIISVVPFVELSLENNTSGIFWTVDVSIARFVLQYFGLKSLLSNPIVLGNYNFGSANNKKTILQIKNKLLGSLVAAKNVLVTKTSEERLRLLSHSNDMSSSINQEEGQDLVESNLELLQTLIRLGCDSQKPANMQCSFGKKAMGWFGAFFSVVGLTGYAGEAYRAVQSIAKYIPYTYLATGFSYVGMGIAILPTYYLVGTRGKGLFELFYDCLCSIRQKNFKETFNKMLPIRLYPKITIAVCILSFAIAALSWATNVEITNQLFANSPEFVADIFRFFAIATSVIFNSSGLIMGTFTPFIVALANFSHDKDVKDTVSLISNSLDRIITYFKKMPLDKVVLVIGSLNDKVIHKLIDGKMDIREFHELVATVEKNTQTSEHEQSARVALQNPSSAWKAPFTFFSRICCRGQQEYAALPSIAKPSQ